MYIYMQIFLALGNLITLETYVTDFPTSNIESGLEKALEITRNLI